MCVCVYHQVSSCTRALCVSTQHPECLGHPRLLVLNLWTDPGRIIRRIHNGPETPTALSSPITTAALVSSCHERVYHSQGAPGRFGRRTRLTEPPPLAFSPLTLHSKMSAPQVSLTHLHCSSSTIAMQPSVASTLLTPLPGTSRCLQTITLLYSLRHRSRF